MYLVIDCFQVDESQVSELNVFLKYPVVTSYDLEP